MDLLDIKKGSGHFAWGLDDLVKRGRRVSQLVQVVDGNAERRERVIRYVGWWI